MNVFLILNTRCFLTVCNALSVRRLWGLFWNMKNFHVKKWCDYYWITLQLELFYRVLWRKWQRVLRQVTTYDEWDCSSVSLKLKDDLCFFVFCFLFGVALKCLKQCRNLYKNRWFMNTFYCLSESKINFHRFVCNFLLLCLVLMNRYKFQCIYTEIQIWDVVSES